LLRVHAGVYTTPVMTLDETWLTDTQQIHVQPKRARVDVVNVVNATFADEQVNYQISEMPRVAPATYITEDGTELPLNLTMSAVQFVGQAQHVSGCLLRDARKGMQLTVLCNMKAYPVELFDVIGVTLDRFGWVNKPFEVFDVSWSFSGGIQLVLKETDSTVYAVRCRVHGLRSIAGQPLAFALDRGRDHQPDGGERHGAVAQASGRHDPNPCAGDVGSDPRSSCAIERRHRGALRPDRHAGKHLAQRGDAGRRHAAVSHQCA